MKHLKKMNEDFATQTAKSNSPKKDASKVKALVDLYSGIQNDYSIRRNTMGWEDVIKAIMKHLGKDKFKQDEDIQFEDSLVMDAIEASEGKLKSTIEGFGRELGFAKETMSDKADEKYGKRRPVASDDKGRKSYTGFNENRD